MTKAELKQTKMNMLGAMHSIVMNEVNDEELQMWWLEECVPNQPTEEDFEFIAEDIELWVDCCRIFGKIMWNCMEVV